MGYDKAVDSAALDKLLTEIADATKTKTVWTTQNNKVVSEFDKDGTYKIPADELAWRISCIDRLNRMTLYPDGLDNGFYGVLASRCAGTYRVAQVLGRDIFDYNDDINVFNTVVDRFNRYTAGVRDAQGRAVLDCSSYMGLVLRGIPYSKSPFIIHDVPNDRWVPSVEMVYGDEGWEYPVIDKQPETEYRKTGFDGFSSLRSARHQAEFFYKYGYVVYDRERDGLPTEALQELVKPGDLLFWSYVDEDGNYDQEKVSKATNNFRAINHVGMVTDRTNYYFHVTGDTDNVSNEEPVSFSALKNKVFYQLSMICRPDYRKGRPLEIPAGANVLGFPWNFSSGTTYGGVTFTFTGDSGETIKLTGTRTGSSTAPIAIKGRLDDKYSRFDLPGGSRYALHLGNPRADPGIKLVLCREVNGEADEFLSCFGGGVTKFLLPDTRNCFIRIYLTKGVTFDCEITPTLERVEDLTPVPESVE